MTDPQDNIPDFFLKRQPVIAAAQPATIDFEGQGHKFCYVYWEHGPNSITSLYFIDTPYPIGAEPVERFRSQNADAEMKAFIANLKAHGWQIFGMQANQEVYETLLLRPPTFENGYEYCLLTCTTFQNATRPSELMGLYRLGEQNENMKTMDKWNMKYDEALQYLEGEHWQLDHTEEYLMFKPSSNARWGFQFYKRPLA